MKRSVLGRVLILLLVLVLAGGLTGCGNGGAAPPAEDPPAAENGEDAGNGAAEPGDVDAAELLDRGRALESFSYEYVFTMPTGEVVAHKMWFSRGNMRVEMEDPMTGELAFTIVNADEGMSYFYQPEMGMAFSFPIGDEDVGQDLPQDVIYDTDPSDLFLVGRETIDGRACLVYEVSVGGDSSKLWIWEDAGLPLRVETRTAGELYVVEYRNFQIAEIDGAMFMLPPGIEIMALDEYMLGV